MDFSKAVVFTFYNLNKQLRYRTFFFLAEPNPDLLLNQIQIRHRSIRVCTRKCPCGSVPDPWQWGTYGSRSADPYRYLRLTDLVAATVSAPNHALSSVTFKSPTNMIFFSSFSWLITVLFEGTFT